MNKQQQLQYEVHFSQESSQLTYSPQFAIVLPQKKRGEY
jgi:hypothetical protein